MKNALLLLGGLLLGAALGAAAKWLVHDDGYPLWIVAGGVAGLACSPLLVGVFRWWRRDAGNVEVIESIEIGGISFKLASPQRKVAWRLFVEVMSRAAAQPLNAAEGDDREVLASLHSLFDVTRAALRKMPPTPAESGITIELYALQMLNRDLRPFLSKWHPALAAWEKRAAPDPTASWPQHARFREELELVRQSIHQRARIFGELGGVEQLDGFFADPGR